MFKLQLNTKSEAWLECNDEMKSISYRNTNDSPVVLCQAAEWSDFNSFMVSKNAGGSCRWCSWNSAVSAHNLTSHCSLLSRKRICRSGSSGSAMRRVWEAWPGATQTSVDTFVSPAGAKTNYQKKLWVNLSHVEMHRGRKRYDFLFFGRFLKVFVSVPSGSLFASGCANKQTSAGWFYKSSSRSKKGSCKGFLCLGRLKKRRCEIADC